MLGTGLNPGFVHLLATVLSLPLREVRSVTWDEYSHVGFYEAPDEYPEPLFLLKPDQRVFAVSTQSCRVQEFKQIPANLGVKLGTFLVQDDVFKFVPADAGKPVKE